MIIGFFRLIKFQAQLVIIGKNSKFMHLKNIYVKKKVLLLLICYLAW